ncbi:MAG: hypothetical protein ACYCY1_11430 [Sulfuriferula sp.]
MADTDSNITDFHPVPASFSILADVVRKADPEAFQRSANMLDMAPSSILRGLAYASYCLSIIPDDEQDPRQMGIARRAIGEMTELMAVLIEHQSAADTERLLCAHRSQAAA